MTNVMVRFKRYVFIFSADLGRLRLVLGSHAQELVQLLLVPLSCNYSLVPNHQPRSGNSEDKAMYQGVQKLLVHIMIPIESIPQTYGFLDALSFWRFFGMGWANFIIVAQLFAGSYLVFFIDELVSKWGIGSAYSVYRLV